MRSCQSRVAIALCGCVTGAVILPIAASAFRSYPTWNSVHSDIARDAAQRLGFDARATARLEVAARQLDWNESTLSAKPNIYYEASHHFDRAMGVSDRGAFASGARYVREMRDQAIGLLEAGRTDEAMEKIGFGIHALQDFFSHSDYAALDEGAREACAGAILDGGALPECVRLAGFDPKAPDPYSPPGDPYPHGKDGRGNAKDEPPKSGATQSARPRDAGSGATAGAPPPQGLSAAERDRLLRREQGLLGRLMTATTESEKLGIRAEMANIAERLEPKAVVGGGGAAGVQAGNPGGRNAAPGNSGGVPCSERYKQHRSTDFAVAKQGAIEATVKFLRQVRAAVPPDRWEALAEAPPRDLPPEMPR